MALEPSGDSPDPMCRSRPIVAESPLSQLSCAEGTTNVGGRPTPIGTGMTADSQQENSCSSDGSAGAAVIPLLPTDYFLPQLGQERVCLPNETHVKLLDRPPLTTAFPCLNQSCDVPTEAELNEFVVGSWPLGHSTAAALPTSTLLSSAGDEVDSGRLSVATTTSTSSLSAASVRSSGSSGTSDYSNPSKNTFASPSDSKHHRTGVDRSWSSATTATLPSRCPTTSSHSVTVIPIAKNLGDSMLLSTSIPVSWPDQYRTTCIAAPPNKSVFDIDENCSGGHRPHSNSFTLGQNYKLKRDAMEVGSGKGAQLGRRPPHSHGVWVAPCRTEASGHSNSGDNSGSGNTSTSSTRSLLSDKLSLVTSKKGKAGGGRLHDCYSPAAQLKVAAKPTF